MEFGIDGRGSHTRFRTQSDFGLRRNDGAMECAR